MKKIILTLIAAALAVPAVMADDEKPEEKKDSAKIEFTDVKLVKSTSVKDQNKSGTCWCFAGTAHFENEIWKAKGDSMVNYGEAKHNHSEMAGVLQSFMNSIKSARKLSPAWLTAFEGILDAYFGKVPETFEYKGKTYTPQSFARELGLSTSDYIAITSWTHHPFYSPFILEVADNWVWGEYQNVPIEELKAIVDNAIDEGYSVVWAADVSEPGFKWKEGFAVMPKERTAADMEGTELSRWVKLSDKERENEKYSFKYPIQEIEVTQADRQKWFDSMETTDDHGMVIVGIATDQDGRRYYKVKNSWDTNQIYDGYFYVSEPYFLAKTISIYVNKKAIPSKIAKKMK